MTRKSARDICDFAIFMTSYLIFVIVGVFVIVGIFVIVVISVIVVIFAIVVNFVMS